MNHKFTPQQIDNIEEAIVMWKTVPPKNVFPDLAYWRDISKERPADKVTCNTIACFGGWCCHWPAFQDQGLYADRYDGGPRLGNLSGGRAAQFLFGDMDLFLTRGVHPADGGTYMLDDHTVVMNRLKLLLAKAKRNRV